ncbi:MAG: family 78 glycoside hydrolase catalytic domain [Eubacterium sp.]|nr:family 78 glycoside hydrolase catalytic domain [Eubacterium sp.]
MFNGKWIKAQEFCGGNTDIKNFYMKVKKAFVLKDIPSAAIKITADDYYKLYINGKYVGQGPAPGYDFAYNYNQYDITKYLKTGENLIEVTVYYQGLINRVFVSGDGKQGMIADIFFNGEFAFGTDESWIYCVDNSFISTRTVGYDTAFLEDRDLRIKASEYKVCVEAKKEYEFCAEPFPALEVYPVSVEPIVSDNKYFYDFKQEYAGNLSIKARSDTAGKKIIIRCAEELEENGRPRYKMRCNCDYEETCILDKGENLIEQFDYKAFRYAEIIADKGVEIDSAELLVRHYPFPENSAEIETNDEALKAVFDLCKNTVKYGTQEVFVDCPTREKGQYLGDVFISGFSHLILTKDYRMLKKAIENAAQSIKFSGEILAVSPCAHKQRIADYSLLFPLILWRYYGYTKDRDFLHKMLPVCEYICNYFAKFAAGDGLLNEVNTQWNLVDWPENARDNYDFDLSDPICAGRHNVINAFYISSVQSTERIKKELNIPFENESKALKESFNAAFFNEETQLYTDSEASIHSAIHSNMLPLAFDICPEEYKEKIADFLITKGMRCGTYMAYFYLKALCNAGRKQEAYNAIVSKSPNSWYNMIHEGATTCFEAWSKDGKWNTSLFHPWSTAPIIILFEELADTGDFSIICS